jgi:hypothetical protein
MLIIYVDEGVIEDDSEDKKAPESNVDEIVEVSSRTNDWRFSFNAEP